jgi:Ca2+-transporting ATPase
VLQGVTVLLAVGALFVAMLHLGTPDSAARATAFVALVASDFALVVVNRSYSPSIASALRRANRAFWGMLAITAALLATALAVPPVRDLFHFAPLNIGSVAVALGTGITVLVALEAMKAFGQWRQHGQSHRHPSHEHADADRPSAGTG